MSYDLHIVRTKNWLDAASNPISKQEVELLIAEDSELEWSSSDYVDMNDGNGAITRYFMINWQGIPCFWWYSDQILCSGPDDAQMVKMVDMARAIDAFVVGDDGEIY